MWHPVAERTAAGESGKLLPYQYVGTLRQFQRGAILLQLKLLRISYTLLNGTMAERVAKVRAMLE